MGEKKDPQHYFMRRENDKNLAKNFIKLSDLLKIYRSKTLEDVLAAAVVLRAGAIFLFLLVFDGNIEKGSSL